MGKSRLQERFEHQAAELLAIIQTESQISTAELVSRTGMSEGVVRKRLARLRSEGRITGKGGRLSSLSIEERVGNIERLLLKFLARLDAIDHS